MAKVKSEYLHIRISPGCKTTLREVAKKKGFTMSEMIEYLICDYQFKNFESRVETTRESDDE